MGNNDNKLIKVAKYNTQLNSIINVTFESFVIYRSKGLLAHLLNRKHYIAAKYIDVLAEIISNPDYAGYYNGTIELVKCFQDNIFISIKLDTKRNIYYVATMFEVKKSKVESYVKSGRLKIVNKKKV